MYEILSQFAQTGGLLLFVLAFVLVLIYAFNPRNKTDFDDAAQIPLNDNALTDRPLAEGPSADRDD